MTIDGVMLTAEQPSTSPVVGDHPAWVARDAESGSPDVGALSCVIFGRKNSHPLVTPSIMPQFCAVAIATDKRDDSKESFSDGQSNHVTGMGRS